MNCRWKGIPIIPALRRQEDCKFKANLAYLESYRSAWAI
jgi:hypothetical protein